MNEEIEEIKSGLKKTKLGWIPEDWEVVKLGEIGKTVTGLTYNPSMISDDGTLVLRSSNIQDRVLKFDDNVYVNIEEGGFNKTKAGDILICVRNGSRGLIGKNAIIGEASAGTAFGAFMLVFRSTDYQFLYQLFDTDYYGREIHRNLGATINSINTNNLRDFRFPFPKEHERKAIATCLSTWDTSITKLDALIKAKQQLKKALMQQLLSGKRRLPGFEGEWKRTGAGNIFKSISIKNNPDAELLSVTQDRGVIPRKLLEGRVTMPSGGLDGFKLVEIGNFVISLRSFQGGLEYSEYKGLVSPAYTVLTEKKEIDLDFYRHYFKSYEFIQRLSKAVIGIRDGKQISYNDFCIVKIPDISKSEQTAIAHILNTADKEIELLTNQLEQFKLQKKGLMQKLLTGKKRLV